MLPNAAKLLQNVPGNDVGRQPLSAAGLAGFMARSVRALRPQVKPIGITNMAKIQELQGSPTLKPVSISTDLKHWGAQSDSSSALNDEVEKLAEPKSPVEYLVQTRNGQIAVSMLDRSFFILRRAHAV